MEKVVKVIPKDDYQLLLEFDTGGVKVFDVKPYLNKGIFQQLKDKHLFQQAFVNHGTVVWRAILILLLKHSTIDLCPSIDPYQSSKFFTHSVWPAGLKLGLSF